MSRSVDEVFLASGFRNLRESPSQQINDDQSAAKNYYDHVLQSIDHHDTVLRSAFKEFKFYGVVLKVNTYKDINRVVERTSEAFVQNLLVYGGSKSVEKSDDEESSPTISELYVHIPEITGFIPQVSEQEVLRAADIYMAGVWNAKEEDIEFLKIFKRKCSRFPRFYTLYDKGARPLEIWKVEYPDKNFLYYGFGTKVVKQSDEFGDPITGNRVVDKAINGVLSVVERFSNLGASNSDD